MEKVILIKFINSHYHYGVVLGMFFVITVNFLDGFFMMNSLWLLPKCWMTVLRLIIWFLLGSLGWRETYN